MPGDEGLAGGGGGQGGRVEADVDDGGEVLEVLGLQEVQQALAVVADVDCVCMCVYMNVYMEGRWGVDRSVKGEDRVRLPYIYIAKHIYIYIHTDTHH